MNNVQQLKRAIAQNAADTRAAAQATVRAFVEGQKVVIDDVIAALGVLNMPVSTLETASQLYAEMVALKVPTSEKVATLQQDFENLHAKLNAECARLRTLGVVAIDRRGGWGACRPHPMIRPLFEREQAAKFALDAAVNAVARRDELREQLDILLGEREAPKPQRAEFKVTVNGSRIEDGFVRSNHADSRSTRIVRRPDGSLAIEKFQRQTEPEGNPARRPAGELMKRFYKGTEVSLDG